MERNGLVEEVISKIEMGEVRDLTERRRDLSGEV